MALCGPLLRGCDKMADTDFPTPSVPPITDSYQITRFNDTIGSPYEAGYRQTRARFTRSPKPRTHKLDYDNLTEDDKDDLEEHLNLVHDGATAFNWTPPGASSALLVRYADPLPVFTMSRRVGSTYLWKCSLTFEEV